MAQIKPIVLNSDGTQSQILSSDTIPIGNLGTGTPNGTKFLRDDGVFITPPGGSSSISGTSLFNFDSENDSVVITINNINLTNINLKGFTALYTETTETSLDDFVLNGVAFNIENIIDNVSFDLRATSINNASGIYTIKYLIQY